MERVQKLLARAGHGSRRHNEALIQAGRVTINGRLAKLGDKADPINDEVKVDGKAIDLTQANPIYIALHKPRGVLSSLEDELGEGRKTVRDLIDLPGHLYPVGRLDMPSEGLMLMTNNGRLAHQLTHPRFGHEKTYRVWLVGEVSDEAIRQWRKGVLLEEKMTAPAKVKRLQMQRELTELEIKLREGRKRQIRRVANLLGYEVRRLKRIGIGPLELGDLPAGQWRHLTSEEVNALEKSTGETQMASAKRGKNKSASKQRRRTRQKR